MQEGKDEQKFGKTKEKNFYIIKRIIKMCGI